MTEIWIPLLFSKRCCIPGTTSCFLRQKVNSNVDIASDFEDSRKLNFWIRSNAAKQKCLGIHRLSRRFEACRLMRRYKTNLINNPLCLIIKRMNMRFLPLIFRNTDTWMHFWKGNNVFFPRFFDRLRKREEHQHLFDINTWLIFLFIPPWFLFHLVSRCDLASLYRLL